MWWYIAPAAILGIAYWNARRSSKEGYNFWLTFIFTILMLIGLGALVYKALA